MTDAFNGEGSSPTLGYLGTFPPLQIWVEWEDFYLVEVRKKFKQGWGRTNSISVKFPQVRLLVASDRFTKIVDFNLRELFYLLFSQDSMEEKSKTEPDVVENDIPF